MKSNTSPHVSISMICLATAAIITPAGAVLSFTLTSAQVVHEFTPEVVIVSPGFEFRTSAQVTDSIAFDTAGVLLTNDVTSFDITLSAPAGYLFAFDAGPNSWQFGYNLGFSNEIVDATFTNLTVMFLGVSSGTGPAVHLVEPGGRLGDTTLGGGSVGAPVSSFSFTGLRIAGDVRPRLPATLESASFGFITRNLAANTDPGSGLAISPIPEPTSALYWISTFGLLFIRRRSAPVP